jgi:hypothetical protein
VSRTARACRCAQECPWGHGADPGLASTRIVGKLGTAAEHFLHHERVEGARHNGPASGAAVVVRCWGYTWEAHDHPSDLDDDGGGAVEEALAGEAVQSTTKARSVSLPWRLGVVVMTMTAAAVAAAAAAAAAAAGGVALDWSCGLVKTSYPNAGRDSEVAKNLGYPEASPSTWKTGHAWRTAQAARQRVAAVAGTQVPAHTP